MTNYCPDCGMGRGAHYVDCPRSPHHWPKSATRLHIDPAPTDRNSSASIGSAETDKSEPSAEAVEAVSKAICGDGWWVYAQGKARAALAADPLRRELGEFHALVRGVIKTASMGELPEALEGLERKLAELLEKHA